jgi:hypothetical protein
LRIRISHALFAGRLLDLRLFASQSWWATMILIPNPPLALLSSWSCHWSLRRGNRIEPRWWIAGGLGSSPTTPITRSRRPRSAAPNPSHHPGRSLLPASMNQEHYLERYPGFSTGPATVEQLAFDAIISGEPNRVSAGIYRPVVQTRQRPILEPPSQIPRSPLLGIWLFAI